MKHELREYQKDAVNKLSESFRSGFKHLCLMVATGGGKTSIASSIIKRNIDKNSNFRAFFICDRIELIKQTSKRFFSDGIDHGVIQANNPLTNYNKKVQVCSIQTLSKFNVTKQDIIFIDEAHTLHKAHKDIINKFPDTPIIGLTATPFTKGLGKYFKKLVIGATTKQLQELGFLVNAKVFAPSKPDLEQIKIVAGEYDDESLSKEVMKPKLIGDIVEHWIKLAFNKSTICFATNIAHSKAIKEEFVRLGINAEHIDAYTDDEEREIIIQKFRSGEIKVLTSVDILSKGFDYPGAEVAILARPTKSKCVYIQQVGRVLRISEETGKEEAIILDHSGNTEEHGFCNDEIDYELDNNEKVSSKTTYKKREPSKPVVCPSCFFVKDKVKCSNCGFEFLPKNKIVSTDGLLVEIIKDDKENIVIKKQSSKQKLSIDPVRLYGELLQLCKDKNWKEGRAYYLFSDITGNFITEDLKRKVVYLKTSEEVNKMVKHLQIKKAKSKFKFKNT